MSSTTVRLSEEHARVLRELARRVNEPMQVVLGRAIEDYRRKVVLEATNDAFAALKNNGRQWAEEVAERKAWEETLSDNVEDPK